MKKVLIVTTVQNTVEAFLIPHIKMLESAGYRVTIASNRYKECADELKENEWITIPFSRNPFSASSFKAVKEMRQLIKEHDFEMVHFHTPVAAFLGRYAAMREKQKNIIYTAHGFHFFKGANLLNWAIYYPMELLAARWTDKLITINEEDYEQSLKFKLRKNGRCYKVNGVGLDISGYESGDGERIKSELLIREPEKTVLMIGELNQNKNQMQLIRAVHNLKLMGKNIRVILVGVGSEELKLKNTAKELGVKVSFLGYRKDIKDIIASADAICSMSYREGLPRNIMEGMSAGKPFVVTDIRGNRDIVSSVENGFRVPIDGVEETTVALEKVLYDKELQREMARNNKERVKSFSIQKILENMKEIYNV
ncbi:MAG: glycosyltransferase family 4 protein [Fusobacteriaceae bacterium]